MIRPGAPKPDAIKGYVDRVVKLLEEQKAIGADISDVCAEAKGIGLEPTYLRFAARESLIDAAKRAERDEKRDLYLHAVGLAVDLVRDHGLSLRQAEAITGASKSSIQRALAVPACPTMMAVDPDWQIVDLGKLDLVLSEDQTREMVADDLGDPLLITNPFRARVKAIAAGVKVTASTVRLDPSVPRTLTDDDLAIPSFLRRTKEAVT